ncbi:MAG: hypothetical protein V1672_03020 [Candidatus Diapherotrites archaeon]
MKKIIIMILLFAILPFAYAELCNSESELSVSYIYNQADQKLNLVFEQSNDINAFLIIASDDLETVISEEVIGKSPIEKEYSLVADNYSLTVSDRSNKNYKTQQSCEIEVIAVVAVLPDCEALNGKVCSEDEVCSNMVTASDTDFCCTGACEARIAQEESEEIVIDPFFGFIIIIIMVAVIAGLVVFAKRFAGRKEFEYEEPEKKPKFISEEEGDEPKYV